MEKKPVKDKKAIENGWHGFMKDKLQLANPIASYDEMAGYTDKEAEVDTTDPDFSTAFEIISHSTFIHKLRKHSMNKLAVSCTENC